MYFFHFSFFGVYVFTLGLEHGTSHNPFHPFTTSVRPQGLAKFNLLLKLVIKGYIIKLGGKKEVINQSI